MTDNVHVAYGDDQGATARSLLDAAEALNLDPSVVALNTEHGTFEVPDEVAKKASGVKAHDPSEAQILSVADAVEAARKDREKRTETIKSPTFGEIERINTTATPDTKAAVAAVGGIEDGPTQAPGEDPQAGLTVETTEAASQDAPAKKAAAKRPAAKKTTAAKKAPAKKASKAAPKKEA